MTRVIFECPLAGMYGAWQEVTRDDSGVRMSGDRRRSMETQLTSIFHEDGDRQDSTYFDTTTVQNQ